MTIAETFLAEFENEAKTTRKFLEQLPEDKLDWRPHEKSMTAGQLALHIATIPIGVLEIASADEFPFPDFGRPNPEPKSTKELMEAFETGCTAAREKLPQFSDERLHGTWRATKNGKEILSMPRVAVLRNILLNHLYHHRGQLGVYLRLVGAKVPSSYGPSGDEMPDFIK